MQSEISLPDITRKEIANIFETIKAEQIELKNKIKRLSYIITLLLFRKNRIFYYFI